MSNFKTLDDLEVYKSALLQASEIYKLTKTPKFKYEYSLVDQIRRASISVAANISEGYGRSTKRDFAQFLSIAIGSSNEVSTYIDFIKVNFDIDLVELRKKYEVLTRRLITFRKYILTSSPTTNNQ